MDGQRRAAAAVTGPEATIGAGPVARAARHASASLRMRLLLSHILVITLAVALTFSVALVPVRRSLDRLEVRRLEDRIAPVAAEASFVRLRANLGPNAVSELLDLQSRQLGARILLFGPDGALLHDTGGVSPLESDALSRIHQVAARLPIPPRQSPPLTRIPLASPGIYGGVVRQQRVVVTAVPQTGGGYLALLAPVRHPPVARELFVPVLMAGAAGVFGAFIATVFLSRSIAGPITRLTIAADAVASGDLGHRIPADGPGEVGCLVHSFNTMVARLRAARESQRHLLANVAHELRTPLTSIQGYAQGLADGIFSTADERRVAVATINEEAERVNGLVVQILQLARLESGQSEPKRQAFPIREVAERVQRRHQVHAAEAGVRLDGSEVGPQLVLADETLIEQALDNLVHNAIRHTPAGGHVRISTAVAPAPDREGTHLRIRVSDTGAGISPENLAHVFDRFFRAGEAGTAPGAGFGLGLAIVREIALQYGGTVSVESELGHGTSIALELPLRWTRAVTEHEPV